ncbi:MAG TPA: hypothetical protein VKU60_10915, partial [Chloroflexota bacterium]|nr:hypothetical protein [Chloroflexota bacterium]
RAASSYSEWLYGAGHRDFMLELAKRKTSRVSLDTYATDVAHGKWAIVLGGDGTHLQPLIAQGLPIRQVAFLSDAGGAVTRASSSLVLINRAPHPNAARLFANWVYSKEGEDLTSHALLHNSLRTDVSNEHLPEWQRLDNAAYLEGRYFDIYSPEFIAQLPQLDKELIQLFNY